jgi:hypothetical protein
MGTIYDTIKVLSRTDGGLKRGQKEWLEANIYGLEAKKVGDKCYAIGQSGIRSESCTLEAFKEQEDGTSVTLSFDHDGIERKMTFTVLNEDTEGATDQAKQNITEYPSAVYTASGKLVHLAA